MNQVFLTAGVCLACGIGVYQGKGPSYPAKEAKHTAIATDPSCLFSAVSAAFLSAAGHL